MTHYTAVNEAPLVIQFSGEQPEDVMREAADYLTEARTRGETLTHWTVWPDLRDDEMLWHGTLTTAGAGFVSPWTHHPEGSELLDQWERELTTEPVVTGDCHDYLQEDLTPDELAEYDAWLADLATDIPFSRIGDAAEGASAAHVRSDRIDDAVDSCEEPGPDDVASTHYKNGWDAGYNQGRLDGQGDPF